MYTVSNITVDDGIIIDISKDSKEGRLIDVDGAIVCPSFLNGHTHIGDSIIKDEGYGLSLGEMVKPPNGVKHRALASAEDYDIVEAMKSSMMEMAESGISHFIDYREGGIKGVKLLKEASKDIPITPIILGRDDSFYGDDPDLSKVKKAIHKLLHSFFEYAVDEGYLVKNPCHKVIIPKNNLQKSQDKKLDIFTLDELNYIKEKFKRK